MEKKMTYTFSIFKTVYLWDDVTTTTKYWSQVGRKISCVFTTTDQIKLTIITSKGVINWSILHSPADLTCRFKRPGTHDVITKPTMASSQSQHDVPSRDRSLHLNYHQQIFLLSWPTPPPQLLLFPTCPSKGQIIKNICFTFKLNITLLSIFRGREASCSCDFWQDLGLKGKTTLLRYGQFFNTNLIYQGMLFKLALEEDVPVLYKQNGKQGVTVWD